MSEEVFFLPETVETSAGAVVGRRGRGRAKEEWFLFDAFGEELGGGVGGVGA